MTTQNTCSPTHLDLLESIVKAPLTEEDALLWMILLHTHQIHLRASPAANGSNIETQSEILCPLTHRGAAEVIARVWPDRADERGKYTFWYRQYNTRTPYEDLSQVPREMMPRLFELRNLVARDPRVRAVVEDY
jgi:hypothetical protein